MTAAKMNRLPGARRPSGIDLVGDGGEFVVEPLIVADESPAGHGDLEEDELPAVLGVGLEQVVDGAQAVGNALRVIRAVDADSEETIAVAQLRAPSRYMRFDGRRARLAV